MFSFFDLDKKRASRWWLLARWRSWLLAGFFDCVYNVRFFEGFERHVNTFAILQDRDIQFLHSVCVWF
jgi:hypothetical protein